MSAGKANKNVDKSGQYAILIMTGKGTTNAFILRMQKEYYE